jgi:hypothetical protein
MQSLYARKIRSKYGVFGHVPDGGAIS